MESLRQEKQDEIRKRLFLVREKINDALKFAGRPVDSVTLIGVSKFFPPEYAQTAVQLGLNDLGENRVQELLEKEGILRDTGLDPNWHLIGTLQTNKVKQIIGHCKLIHSVSSLHLLNEIQRVSAQQGLVTDILLQANVSREESKHGFLPEEIEQAVCISNEMPNICVNGLMTMAPIRAEGSDPYTVFEQTKDMFERLRPTVKNAKVWSVLSMGMSQDYIDAIQCGATHIRIGTAIFGHRD
jgi:pyridoxal phosphate enzyme (YggS family)